MYEEGAEPLEALGFLGTRALGVIEKVWHKSGDFPLLVRERICPRKTSSKQRRRAEKETQILRLVKHAHIVKLIGSYEVRNKGELSTYSLLMTLRGR